MTLGPDKYLEDYEEIFQLNCRTANFTLDPNSLKLFLLQWIREDVMETLNMLSRGYVYQFTYDEIKTVFRNHSRTTRKNGMSSQGLISSSPSTMTIKHEIGIILEGCKSEMLHTFSV